MAPTPPRVTGRSKGTTRPGGTVEAAELMTKARYDDELGEVLEGAVILAGAGAAVDGAAGGHCAGFLVVSERKIPEELIAKLRVVANENVDGEVQVVYARAHG
jgi:hypothetical protein